MFCGQMKQKRSFFGNANSLFTDGTMKPTRKRTPYLTVGDGGGSIMLLGCFAASGTGGLDRVTGIIKSENYQEILEQNVLSSVRKLGFSWRSWVLQQHKDPKHSSKSTKEWLKRRKWTVLKWPGIKPDLSLIEIIWWAEICHWGKETCKCSRASTICKEKWEKIPAEKCKKLIDGHKKHLEGIITAKGCATKY